MGNKITDLKFDDKNFNKGTQYGKSLMEKSLSKFGAGRSILIDKNNKIIAGNKTTENFGELGLENVQIVDTDGTTLIAVRRNDIDLDTPEGREFALADNQTAKVNIDFDFGTLEAELDEGVLEDWGISIDINNEPDYEDLISDAKDKKATIKITFESVDQIQEAQNDIQELLDRKYNGAYLSVSAGEL